ncbi:E3 ubiquitin-protein ligase RNF168 [Melopsittacus undulatus]|uniref:RING-type E3 ubiquitin transferase n=1 Tax=Melopsittacus undulatus TaxID=13146 RepID=A0A8C6JG32_MELUD|nr:E3 ubiquitin-protein ligase RNF168 [Melopsittacus undulatus]XP_030906707.1 E3 ubiquitin-protein ligase RNF168 [Melopsittacus undulatus]XP_033920111.1 E3 ubiquitin-protein ligase RNF168 [Melopsittacus undulatus]XP_033920112.1 E3 ubiquitin-protein ligase RNF168 [Melopsittacus undulatus]XP_033920113.1 E3 ubiquitin-protein ligase RNF168 [Melopsittacus undulatus]
MSKKSGAPLSLSDCLCPICMEIFVEPVTLPCNHTLCNSCFQLTVEKASLCCPFCRRRVSSWARYNARRNTLVNWELWEKIQKHYPKECERRINGQDLEEEICVPHPQHQLSKPGELRQEYEAEISKVEAERRAHEQEENKASEEYIQRLLAEEEEEQRLVEERRREMEKQLKQDEELAWRLSNSLNDNSRGHGLSSPAQAGSVSLETSPAHLCKMKSKPSNSEDIQKYLSPKLHHTLGSASSSRTRERGRGDSGSAETNGNEGSSSAWQNDQEEMPTLSPQLTSVNKDSSAVDSFLESCMNYFSTSASGETTVKQEETPGANCVEEISEALHGITKREGSGTVLRSKGEDDGCKTDSGSLTHLESINVKNSAGGYTCIQAAANSVVSDSTSVVCDLKKVARHSDEEKPESLQNTKETPKRKLLEPPAEEVVDFCVLDKRRRTFPESLEEQGKQINDFNLQMQKAFEQEIYERRMQEEQDRLLALQLQKQINKEERTLNRQKGSPDQYLLRTKPPQSVKDSSARKGSSKVARDSKVSKNQAETNHRKTRRGSCNENWQSPARVRMKSPSINGGKVLNCVVNTSDANDICSLPKNKQKTILQMFKSPVAE